MLVISGDYVNELFNAAHLPSSSTDYDSILDTDPYTLTDPFFPPLTDFIRFLCYRLHCTLESLTLALFYLHRLKSLHPICHGSPGTPHKLVLCALMCACKILYDDHHTNTVWAKASELFSLEQVNRMEREFLQYIDHGLFVPPGDWDAFLEEMDARLGRAQLAVYDGRKCRRGLRDLVGMGSLECCGRGCEERHLLRACPDDVVPSYLSLAAHPLPPPPPEPTILTTTYPILAPVPHVWFAMQCA
ncbi:hypothetical protein SpCBS45565_g01151 [Spizellomyces sp. 'palustris']|nr:hypothetical protein SpCBS45565_g01151 [Spizellomyces sp. 'palustris']